MSPDFLNSYNFSLLIPEIICVYGTHVYLLCENVRFVREHVDV